MTKIKYHKNSQIMINVVRLNLSGYLIAYRAQQLSRALNRKKPNEYGKLFFYDYRRFNNDG